MQIINLKCLRVNVIVYLEINENKTIKQLKALKQETT